jgi:hypothetical protein
MSHRVLAIVTDRLQGSEPLDQICGRDNGTGAQEIVEVRLVVPSVEANLLRHTLGDVDEPRHQAEERLRTSLQLLRGGGIEATGEVGDPDPIQAARDALLKTPADEVVIFEHADAQDRWYEDGLFERAQETLEPPLRLVVVETAADSEDHVVKVEEAGAGTVDFAADREVGSAYLPGLTRGDLAGMILGVVGTIVAILLAAAAAVGDSSVTGWDAAAIGIAIGVALVNMAQVVGLVLFETVRYRGGFATLLRTLSLVGTPLAVLANLLILILA